MPTVAQEMSPEERAQRLLKGLVASGSAEEVVVDFSQLAHAVGMEVAESLVVVTAGQSSTAKSDYSKQERLVRSCNCVVNRKQALDAVKKVLTPKPVNTEPSNDF
jgi:hypothetical protein